MPSGLDIDYKRQLTNTVAPYSDHLLIHTGTVDWPSRIEDDARFPLAAEFKAALKREVVKASALAAGGGGVARPANVLVSNSSLPPASSADGADKVVVSLMKAGVRLAIDSSAQDVSRLVDAILAPRTSRDLQEHDIGATVAGLGLGMTSISELTILICGHGNRDSRCGIMGPLLQHEFRDKLARKHIQLLEDPVVDTMTTATDAPAEAGDEVARVGLISHIGGHAFAGNVILYVPRTAQYTDHPLAGKGVWYGRVQPQHVEGIVDKTIRDGVIIDDLLRGVV